jgi:hypothetical protein
MDGDKQPTNEGGSWQFKPGDTVSPGASATATAPPPPVVTSPAPSPTPKASPAPAATDNGISWTASEFIAHQKSSGWYGLLALGAIAAAVVIWFVTKDAVSTIVILFAALALGVYGRRQPRELDYNLDGGGLTIAQKYYPYAGFRSFAVMAEGAMTSIVFMPLKRFQPLITIYYDPHDEEAIVDLLSDRLPMEERRQDALERLMWRIRF